MGMLWWLHLPALPPAGAREAPAADEQPSLRGAGGGSLADDLRPRAKKALETQGGGGGDDDLYAEPSAQGSGAATFEDADLYDDAPAPAPAPAPATRAPAPGPDRESLPPASSGGRCVLCGARPHGFPPTTQVRPAAAGDCEWAKYPGHRYESRVEDLPFAYSETTAKAICIDLGDGCSGVTCASEMQCEVHRSSKQPRKGTQNEVSFAKSCASEGQGVYEPPRGVDCAPKDSPEQATDLSGAAVIILGHDRDDNLRDCLKTLLHQPDAAHFRFYISLDKREAVGKMKAAADRVAHEAGVKVEYWHVSPYEPDPAKKFNEDQLRWFRDYNTAKIAHHYWTAFERAFMEHRFEHAIFLEEDLAVAPDFLALFRSTAWLLEADSSLWCVSAWNDQGFAAVASDQCRLQRTTYFPGLGFLFPRTAWLELREIWVDCPLMGWDYWTRTAFRQKGKECIQPEVPRTHHISETGSSIRTKQQQKFFAAMALARRPSSCGSSLGPCRHFGDVSYLLQSDYEARMTAATQGALIVKREEFMQAASAKLHAERRECVAQALVLEADSIESCARIALSTDECSEYFQFAPEETSWGCRCCKNGSKGGSPHSLWNVYQAEKSAGKPTLDKHRVYVMTYVYDEFHAFHSMFGLMPHGSNKHVIPADIRSEHYGAVWVRHVEMRVPVLLLDRRSTKAYLPDGKRSKRHPDLRVHAAHAGESCTDACARNGAHCDEEQMNFINNCVDMTKHFECKCAHQVGEELPVFVSDKTDASYGQCVVSFISKMHCTAKHPHTTRLCACLE